MKVSALWYKILIFFFSPTFIHLLEKVSDFQLDQSYEILAKKADYLLFAHEGNFEYGKRKKPAHTQSPACFGASQRGKRDKKSNGAALICLGITKGGYGEEEKVCMMLLGGFHLPSLPRQNHSKHWPSFPAVVIPRCKWEESVAGIGCREHMQITQIIKKIISFFTFFLVWKQLKFP